MTQLPSPEDSSRAFVLQTVQPALLGLMDGSVSTLAPIFAAADEETVTIMPLSDEQIAAGHTVLEAWAEEDE